MIRHKATGTELAWRPTLDRWGTEGTGWALESIDNRFIEVFVYPDDLGGSEYTRKEEALAALIADGTIEVVPDEPPASEEKDYDAIHRAGDAEQRSIYVEALATVAAHEWSTVELRSAAICELRRLALEAR